MQGSQCDLLVGSYIACKKETRIHAPCVFQTSGVEGEQISSADLEPACPVIGTQRVCSNLIGAVDVGGVDEVRNLIDLLPRVHKVDPCSGMILRAMERDLCGSASCGIEERIASGYVDRGRLERIQ